MKRPKKHVSEIVVKKLASGKLSFKLSGLQFRELRESLHPWMAGNMVPSHYQHAGLGNLAKHMVCWCLEEFGARIDWADSWRPRLLTVTRTQAAAIAFTLVPSDNAYMIELKAALLKAR